QVLSTDDVQRAGAGTGGDQHMPRVIAGAVDGQGGGAGEGGAAVEGRHAVGGQSVLHPLGDGVGEAVLVAHQVGPVDRQAVRVDALAGQQSGAVDDLGTA